MQVGDADALCCAQRLERCKRFLGSHASDLTLSACLEHSSLKWKCYAELKCQISINVLVLR